MATFVLVHGGWHAGLSWRPVERRLRAAGHEVFAPTLTGLGERRHLFGPGIDLDTHIQDVVGLIDYEHLSGIVLAGHSYGGMVVTGAADRRPDRIASLVYVDAFVPENGQSLVDLEPPGHGLVTLVPGVDGIAPPPAAVFGLSPEAAAFYEAAVSPMPAATCTQPLTLTGGIGRIGKKTYVYCNDPQPTSFTQFYDGLKGRQDWAVHTLPCGHNVMRLMPDELTAILLGAIPS